ncbi:hypothetical protein [Cognatiluteimonas telluris]|jgi:hypothetical protein|nr:hypothetical protein [Lysobacter telluris]
MFLDNPAVAAEPAAARGHPDARIGKMPGGNCARVMHEVWK